jgi:hypothetical protein
VQQYFNPGALVVHINYRNDGKIATITYSSAPYRDTLIYSGDYINTVIRLAADGSPMDTTVYSENQDGWITDVRVNLRIEPSQPSIFGHIT